MSGIALRSIMVPSPQKPNRKSHLFLITSLRQHIKAHKIYIPMAGWACKGALQYDAHNDSTPDHKTR